MSLHYLTADPVCINDQRRQSLINFKTYADFAWNSDNFKTKNIFFIINAERQ